MSESSDSPASPVYSSDDDSSTESTSGVQSSKWIECKICLRKYNDHNRIPRVLTCGHTVCEQCVDAILLQNVEPKCPFDRQLIEQIHPSLLPKNYSLVEYLDDKARKNAGKMGRVEPMGDADEIPTPQIQCEGDASHEATVHCEQCSADLCEECFTKMHRLRKYAEHKKIPLAEKPYEFSECQTHAGEKLVYVCENGERDVEVTLACRICVLTHPGHEHKSVEEDVFENKKVLEEAWITHTADLKIQRKMMKDWNRAACSYSIRDWEYTTKLNEIAEHFDKMKMAAQNKFRQFVNATHNMFMERLNDINKCNERSLVAQQESESRLRTRTKWESVERFLRTSHLPSEEKQLPRLHDTVLVFPRLPNLRLEVPSVKSFWDQVKFDEKGKAIVKFVEVTRKRVHFES